MASYESARTRAFTQATTTTVTGVPLEVSDDHPLRRLGQTPIQSCVCVTDPCPCDGHPILWVDESAVLSRTATGRRSADGDEVYDFAVSADAFVTVESFRRVRASDTAGLRSSATPAAPPPLIVRHRPDAGRSGAKDHPCQGGESSVFRADPGCNDYEITENGVTYCFVESSEHYCIYVLC
ncbi:hypothetical protein ABTX77_16960 [Streptomyces sp. NPDC097704]|uniref:hypothetical protein n=1 Tax=Streptomyces sp. NPDC097704 TaxID=3157101 RepID=UPI00331F5F67